MANRTQIKLRNTTRQLTDSAVTSDTRLAGEPLVQKYSTAPTVISVGVGSSNVVDPADVFVADSLIQPVPSLVSSTLIYTGAAQAPVPSPYDDRFVTFTVAAQTNKGNNYTAVFSLKKISNAVPNGVKWSDNTITDKSFTWSIVEAPTSAQGIPAGGSANQVISKVNSTDYNVTWRTVNEVPTTGTTGHVLTKNSSGYGWAAAPHELPAGGTNGQVLVKDGSTDYTVKWGAAASSTPFVVGSAATPPGTADTSKFYISTDRRLWYYNGATWMTIVGTWGANS